MTIEKKTALTINGLTMTWDEDARRAWKPCTKCGELTKGRMEITGKPVVPACVTCAIESTVSGALAPLKAAR